MLRQGPVIFPTDFSECSLHALATAEELAQRLEKSLLIIHVAESVGAENITFGEVEQTLQPAGYRSRLQADLQTIRPTADDLKVEYLITDGDPPKAILQLAEERHASLIVMGTHGRTGVQRLLLGGTTQYVVRHAVCPVVTIKQPPESSHPA
ncbi:MAG TPA: universal stress protein [Pirellulales bacterium]|jgi:nucleotide-binding universal stress UspA family protein|nr:universal stress protein [Pirellulales bacterium]